MNNLRVVTYNVFGFRRLRQFDIQRFADALSALKPDVLMLQEVDEGRLFKHEVPPVQALAGRLSMHQVYHPVYQVSLRGGTFGNAILSKYPLRNHREGRLPGKIWKTWLEPRGAVWTEITLPGQTLQVMTTHLSFWPFQQKLQAESLAVDWVEPALKTQTPVLLGGDFNMSSNAKALRLLSEKLQPANPNLKLATWPAKRPHRGLDHIFTSRHFTTLNYFIPPENGLRQLSDHLPVIADLKLLERSE